VGSTYHIIECFLGGVKIIKEILKKNVLCQHDVKDINQAYRAIDLLERQIDRIPEHNSQHVLEKIIKKVETIACDACDKNISARDLITLYWRKALPM
jgi:hypothetical protein